MSLRTTLCIVNFSGQAITNIQVTSESGFESGNEPSTFLKNGLANNSALCGYTEVDNSGPSPFTVEFTFADGHNLIFTDDQQNAINKHVCVIPHTGSAGNLQVWRSSGGDVGRSTHGTNGIYIRPTQAPDNSDWMKKLLSHKPDVRLNQLLMPGSHDAGMYVTHDYPLGGGGAWAKTQNLAMLQQLQAGARYFDIRICTHNGVLTTYHGDTGYGAYGATLDEMLADVRSFLSSPSGSGEVVILKFSHTYSNSTAGTIAAVKDPTKTGDFLYIPDNPSITLSTVLLSKVQGRVLAVFGDEFTSDAENGIYPYHDVDKDASLPIPTHAGLTVYDNYSNDGNYEAMVNDQIPKLQTYGGWGNTFLFLLSWTLTGWSGIRDIEVLAGMANPWLPVELSEIEQGKRKWPVIAYIDFLDPYLCSAIIDANGRVLDRCG
jgi:1-phosphatidylinositol phosphodiesterase